MHVSTINLYISLLTKIELQRKNSYTFCIWKWEKPIFQFVEDEIFLKDAA